MKLKKKPNQKEKIKLPAEGLWKRFAGEESESKNEKALLYLISKVIKTVLKTRQQLIYSLINLIVFNKIGKK